MRLRPIVFVLILFSIKPVLSQDQAAALEKQVKISNTLMTRAVNAEAEVMRLRYLMTSRSLVDVSTTIGAVDKELKALLALQAFNFNSNFGGNRNDNTLYQTISKALKSYGLPKKLPSISTNALVSSAKTNSVYALGTDGKITRWAPEKNEWRGDQITQLSGKSKNRSMFMSKTGSLLAVVSINSKSNTRVVELVSESGTKPINGFYSEVEKIVFVPEDKGFYALCDKGQSIFYCDLTTAKEVIRSKDRILDIDLNSDGSKIAGSCASGVFFSWNTSDYSAESHKIFSKSNNQSIISFMPTNKDLMISDETGRLLNISVDGQQKRVLPGLKGRVIQLAVSHSKNLMATLSSDSTIRIWNLNNLPEAPRTIENPTASSFVFSPDDTKIICIDKHGSSVYFLNASDMAEELCRLVTRNLTLDEWESFIGSTLKYEASCAPR